MNIHWLSLTELVVGPYFVKLLEKDQWQAYRVPDWIFQGSWAQAVAYALLHARLLNGETTTADHVLTVQKLLDYTWPEGEVHDDDHFTMQSAYEDLAIAVEAS